MLEEIIKAALKEDDAFRDITSDLTIPEGEIISFEITPRERIFFVAKR